MVKKPQQYKRGFTAQSSHPPDTRAARLQGRNYNPVAPVARSVLMSPPTGDTQEPRLSRFKKRLSKGKR
jgi:hypothetical protein